MCVRVGHYQLAILTLISGDLSDSPMGTDKEPIDDEAEVEKEGTIQYNTIQYNTIQYNTIQYNTTQYNTIQYNTIQ